MKENLIRDKSFNFALKIIKLHQQLQNEREFVISKQLLRSGTSIGANIEEAGAAQSKKDFMHRMSIASKEARETKYWIKLLKESKLANVPLETLLNEIDQMINILTRIVKTTAEKINAK